MDTRATTVRPQLHMLPFALVAGLVGVTACALLAALALSGAAVAAASALYVSLFVSVFVSFGPAVLAHPARSHSGGTFSVGLRPVLRTAAAWTMALAALSVFALLGASLAMAGGGFEIDGASLAGRADRQLMLCAFFSVFHAFAVMIASSGLNYDLSGTLGPGARLPALTLSSVTRGSLTFRTADNLRFWQIPLELAGAALFWYQARSVLADASPLLRRSLLLVFLFPLAHAAANLLGRVSFSVTGNHLTAKHFPWFFRDRRIRISDINGIQVNAEVDREGNVTHYSLLVVGLSLKTDRLVHFIPNQIHAEELAERIEALIAPHRVKVAP